MSSEVLSSALQLISSTKTVGTRGPHCLPTFGFWNIQRLNSEISLYVLISVKVVSVKYFLQVQVTLGQS